jgi:Spy/CpxP family protein refolding chaperone
MLKRNVFAATVVAWGLCLLCASGSGAQYHDAGGTGSYQTHDSTGWQATLDCTDEEWSVIEPRLEKVLALRADPYGPVRQRHRELHHLVKHDARADLILDRLEALREARAEADLALAQSEADLRQVLTIRQEATLVLMGVIE